MCYLQVSEPILAKTFHRKVQSKKVFSHRESFDAIIAKTEEKLAQVIPYDNFIPIYCKVWLRLF